MHDIGQLGALPKTTLYVLVTLHGTVFGYASSS